MVGFYFDDFFESVFVWLGDCWECEMWYVFFLLDNLIYCGILIFRKEFFDFSIK